MLKLWGNITQSVDKYSPYLKKYIRHFEEVYRSLWGGNIHHTVNKYFSLYKEVFFIQGRIPHGERKYSSYHEEVSHLLWCCFPRYMWKYSSYYVKELFILWGSFHSSMNEFSSSYGDVFLIPIGRITILWWSIPHADRKYSSCPQEVSCRLWVFFFLSSSLVRKNSLFYEEVVIIVWVSIPHSMGKFSSYSEEFVILRLADSEIIVQEIDVHFSANSIRTHYVRDAKSQISKQEAITLQQE